MDSRHYDPSLLIRAREADGKSQEEVANTLSVNRQTIYRIEAGKNASFDILARYCMLYGIKVTDVIYPSPRVTECV